MTEFEVDWEKVNKILLSSPEFSEEEKKIISNRYNLHLKRIELIKTLPLQVACEAIRELDSERCEHDRSWASACIACTKLDKKQYLVLLSAGIDIATDLLDDEEESPIA